VEAIAAAGTAARTSLRELSSVESLAETVDVDCCPNKWSRNRNKYRHQPRIDTQRRTSSVVAEDSVGSEIVIEAGPAPDVVAGTGTAAVSLVVAVAATVAAVAAAEDCAADCAWRI
jgi:hypothetical protein